MVLARKDWRISFACHTKTLDEMRFISFYNVSICFNTSYDVLYVYHCVSVSLHIYIYNHIYIDIYIYIHMFFVVHVS